MKVSAWLMGAVLLASPSARADEPARDTCIESYVAAQAARKDEALLKAQTALEICANPSCPGMIVRDCTEWLSDVRRRLPSIVVTVRDPSQHDLLDVAVSVDGTKAMADGKPLTLDPGRHVVRFERAGEKTQEQILVLAPGEHERPVAAVFTPEVKTHSARVPLGAWVLGGVGVVSLGVFTGFAIVGASDRSHLGCDRACSASDYAHVNGEFTVADVALGVGVASLAAAVVWVIVHPSSSSDPKTQAFNPSMPLSVSF